MANLLNILSTLLLSPPEMGELFGDEDAVEFADSAVLESGPNQLLKFHGSLKSCQSEFK